MSERAKQALFIAGSLVVMAVGYYSYMFIFFRSDWNAASKAIAKEYKKGDVVAIFPSWLRENVDAFKGMAAVAPREDTYVNFQGFKRAWGVMDTKHTPNHSDRMPLINRMKEVGQAKLVKGEMAIRLFDLPSYNATAVFSEARVYKTSDGRRDPCIKEGSGNWKCGPNHWQYVGPVKVDISGHNVECIWAHPIEGKPVEIELTPPVSWSRMYLYTAFADSGSGGGFVPPVTIEVSQGGEKIFEYTHPQKSGWVAHENNYGSGRVGPLLVKFSTQQGGRQHWCFNIEAD